MLVVDAHCHLPESFSARDLETIFEMGFVAQVWALSAPLTHWTGERDNDEVLLELARDFEGKLVPFGYLCTCQPPVEPASGHPRLLLPPRLGVTARGRGCLSAQGYARGEGISRERILAHPGNQMSVWTGGEVPDRQRERGK